MNVKRNQQLERVLKITKWLEQSRTGLTTQQIFNKLNDFGEKVTLRTVYRDLTAIEHIYGPSLIELPSDEEQSSRWKIETEAKSKFLSKYTEGELIAYYFTKYAIQPNLNLESQNALGQTLHLLENFFGPKEIEYLKQLEKFIQFGSLPFPKVAFEKQVFYDLLGCMFEEAQAEIHTEKETLTLTPHHLLIDAGNIWLICDWASERNIKLNIAEFINCKMI